MSDLILNDHEKNETCTKINTSIMKLAFLEGVHNAHLLAC